MTKFLVFVFMVFSSVIFSQTGNFQKFKKLSGPKKCWVILHPFKAKKALIISSKIKKVADSIKRTTVLDGDASGGQVDAFRHAYWMASLRLGIGQSAARSLGKAHEKENYQYFKANKLEDGILPDKVAGDMDLHNNEMGLSLVKKGENISKTEIIERVIRSIQKGKMKVIKKDRDRRFLTCKGEVIEEESLQNKWINNKCLIPSN